MATSVESRIEALEGRFAEEVRSRDEHIEALEARVQYLEDVRAVVDLQRKWDKMCAGGFNGIPTHKPDEALALLTEDATLEYQALHNKGEGPTGIEALQKHFSPIDGELPCAFQMTGDYDTRIDGDTAWQRSHCYSIIQPQQPDVPPRLRMYWYTMDCVRTSEGWKIKRMSFITGLTAPLGERMFGAQIEPGSGWSRDD